MSKTVMSPENFNKLRHRDFQNGAVLDEIYNGLSELARLRANTQSLAFEVEQTLGKALGYPWYKDDQKNFPGATEADGVCVGEHVPESIAAEAARTINRLRAENRRMREFVHLLACRRQYIGISRFEAETIEQARALEGTLARTEPEEE